MRLRSVRAPDVGPLAAWLPRTARDAGCERWAEDEALAGATGSEQVLACVEDGVAALLEYETGAPIAGAAQVRFLAVDPARRRLGLGGRAALALERRLERSAAAIYVRVPERLGLALYFWLRLGYRPLTQREWPAPIEGGPAAWLVRELPAG